MKKHLYLMIITALGIAMFFVIGKFVAIPTPIPNFALFLQYSVLVVFSFYFGPIVGFSIGFLGHLLIDLFSGYGIWIFWIIGSGLFGLFVGLGSFIINRRSSPFKVTKILLLCLFAIVGGAICWVLIAPIGDMIFYQEPFNVVLIEGLVAFGTNELSALAIGLPLVFALKKVRIPYTIVNKEENKVENN
jgi:energy-coupling factor transport system substrate-specific component